MVGGQQRPVLKTMLARDAVLGQVQGDGFVLGETTGVAAKLPDGKRRFHGEVSKVPVTSMRPHTEPSATAWPNHDSFFMRYRTRLRQCGRASRRKRLKA